MKYFNLTMAIICFIAAIASIIGTIMSILSWTYIFVFLAIGLLNYYYYKHPNKQKNKTKEKE